MRPKLLIVEDDDLTLKVYQFVLSKDYELTECKNESELLNALNEGEYDIFIIDLSLIEGKNGIDIIKELRHMLLRLMNEMQSKRELMNFSGNR
ncbi:MAG: response regulator [Melioribacteraceae bacterium]